MSTLTTPRNADELAEMLGDETRLKQIMASRDSLQSFITDYATAQLDSDPGIEAQIKTETERQFAAIMRRNDIDWINRVNLAPQPRATGWRHGHNPVAGGLDKHFENGWLDYLPAIWDKTVDPTARQRRDEIMRFQNALGSTVPSDGGFLIPERLRSELLRVSLETALVRPRARVIPMDSLTVPFPTIDSTSNASSVYGGIVGYWTEEGGALVDSSPNFGRVTLMAKKLTVYSEIPNELFQDSIISLQAFMDEAYPEAISWFEDIAFISGGGVGEPIGFLNADAAVSVAAESGQDPGTIVWENLANVYSRMLPSSLGRAVWVAHIDTFPQLATMALSVGTGGSAVWIGNGAGNAVGAGAGAPPTTIFGRPVLFTEKVSSVGTAGDINFVDFGYYLIGDRMAMQAATSTDYKFGNDKTAMRVIERVDGQPWLKSAITPQTGSNTLSPFVKIATRS